jgi:hypothetical protein
MTMPCHRSSYIVHNMSMCPCVHTFPTSFMLAFHSLVGFGLSRLLSALLEHGLEVGVASGAIGIATVGGANATETAALEA